LMQEARVRVGDTVTIAADAQGGRAKRFRVVGTYEPIPDPRKFSGKRLDARLHLPDLIALAEDPKDPATADAVTSVNLVLKDPNSATAVGSAISARLPGMGAESSKSESY